jgi:exodeoxyribonuclease VII large subunit
MEPAGVGALLAQLERLKARLQVEGLFDPARKRPLPSMPQTIGVITSPTGAVIRDILHRIRDRWPCHVIVWPVVVQGDAAAAQICAAIAGFNALEPGGAIPRPDVLIVARGGGSVEDLWAFNDEALARAAAASAIPLISAVGHETDTTLIDFVSDRRAPTPTAAAEVVTPVLSELRAALADYQRRLIRCGGRTLEDRRTQLAAVARGLPRPADILALASQRFDLAAGRLGAALDKNAAAHERDLTRTAARFGPGLLERPLRLKAERLQGLSGRFALAAARGPERIAQHARLPALGERLATAFERRLARAGECLAQLDKLRLSLDPDRPLARGFARVHHADGSLARTAASLEAGETVRLVFGDGDRGAVIDAQAPAARPVARARPPKPSGGGVQGDLF